MKVILTQIPKNSDTVNTATVYNEIGKVFVVDRDKKLWLKRSYDKDIKYEWVNEHNINPFQMEFHKEKWAIKHYHEYSPNAVFYQLWGNKCTQIQLPKDVEKDCINAEYLDYKHFVIAKSKYGSIYMLRFQIGAELPYRWKAMYSDEDLAGHFYSPLRAIEYLGKDFTFEAFECKYK